jgi:hypothetical protein
MDRNCSVWHHHNGVKTCLYGELTQHEAQQEADRINANLADRGIPGSVCCAEVVCAEPVTIWDVETTDTFGGEANYCWCDRATVVTPQNDNRRAIRMIRAAAGLTGVRARFADFGDMLEWRQPSACVVTFATVRH